MEGVTEGNLCGLDKKLQDGIDRLDGKGGLIEYRIGLHAEYTNSEKSIRALADFAKAKKLPTYTHLCETKKRSRRMCAKTRQDACRISCGTRNV